MTKWKKKQKSHITENSTNKLKPRNKKSMVNKSKWKTKSNSKEKSNRLDGKLNKNEKKTFSKKRSHGEEEEDIEVVGNKQQKQIHVQDEESSESDSELEMQDTRKWMTEQNRKKKKSGGFQSMGLSHSVYKGIMRKGYKIPTPIQRKTIPLIMEGKDVVAMARTGSGKTAAFLIPMFEKLKIHTAKSGARALILSPTRELALQTLKFTKELGKYTGLRAAVVLGGDKMDDQFAALHENPDIVIATPGRLLHVLVEMEKKLKSVEYVVFDEADRLFEMGFQEQLNEIIHRLPESRQTVLFSATLPKLLVEFAKAGLHDPTLLRLDVETKLSEQLKQSFFRCREEDKPAILLYILKHLIDPEQQSVVFAATKHHVEYLHMILSCAGISSTYIYSSLDPAARKINVAKFQHKKVKVLIVTDLAARGIDIPLLDNVINVNFPAKSKLFVHRVGRVARAGREGYAFSLVAQDEVPFLLDLFVFLGRSLILASSHKILTDKDGVLGDVPQLVIDEMEEQLRLWHTDQIDLVNMKKVIGNALKKYLKSRPLPAKESIKRYKQILQASGSIGIHPVFASEYSTEEQERNSLLNALKSYKGHTTIFETNTSSKNRGFDVMKQKRAFHQTTIHKRNEQMSESMEMEADDSDGAESEQEMADEDNVQETFQTVIGGKRKASNRVFDPERKKKHKRENIRDEENYLHYRPKDFQSELGLSLGTSFDKEASGAMLDLCDEINKAKTTAPTRWDRKKKKFVSTNEQAANKKKIRTESGALISASYKSRAYKDWLNRNKMATANESGDEEEEISNKKGEPDNSYRLKVIGTKRRNWHTKVKEDNNKKGNRGELKHPEQILKQRKLKAKKQAFQKNRHKQKQSRRNFKAQRAKKKH
ncbi:ATP-dependent RNA helicase DDX54-like [Saccostrea echinata]|uniref:ATP-dependent RNA helicase DDX54-like n=1 Tax=Saccostrea echinata TaxID=191078 RepID=UPI002A83F7BA|nr:ATP-dependent RNA helicase DDX54-like [Saccostrea echinata]